MFPHRVRIPRKKLVVVLSVLSAFAAGLAGCGSGGKNAAGSEDRGKLSVMMILFGNEPPAENSPVQERIEAYTGISLDMTWIPSASYDDKVSATLASGKLPEVILLRKDKEQANLNAQQSGLFWDLLPFLKDTEHLQAMNPVAKANAMVDGKLYGIPRERVIARYGIIYRKDWLDRLGLPEPTTVDGIYRIAKAFTRDDPDGDGKNDTFGIQESKELESLKQLAVYLGAPNGWGIRDGLMTPDFMYPEFKQALDLMRRMFGEGLINPDFPIAKKYSYFNEGKAGMYFSVLSDASSQTALQASDPNAVVDVAQNVDGPAGQRVKATNGYDSLLAIPKAAVSSEEEVKRIVTFFDKLGDLPMQNLLNWGIEGTDYVTENGTARKIPGAQGAGDYWSLKWDDPFAGMSGIKTPLEQKIDRLTIDNEKLAVPNLTAPLISRTNVENGKSLETAIYDAEVRFIMGDLDDSGWEKAVQKWRQNGGDRMRAEWTANDERLNGSE